MDISDEALLKMKRKQILALPEEQQKRACELLDQHKKQMIRDILEENTKRFDETKKTIQKLYDSLNLKTFMNEINKLNFQEPLQKLANSVRFNYLQSFTNSPKISIELPFLKSDTGIHNSLTIFSTNSLSISKNSHINNRFSPIQNIDAMRHAMVKTVCNDDPWQGKYCDEKLILNLLNRQIFFHDKYIPFSYYHFEVFRVLAQGALDKKAYVPYSEFEPIWGEDRSTGLLKTVVGEIKVLFKKSGIPKQVVSNIFCAIRGRGYQLQIPAYAIRIIHP